MNVTVPPTNQVAEAYQVSRQQIWNLKKRAGLIISDFTNPDLIFSVLLSRPYATPLRRRLSDPATRSAIARKLTL